jgi:phage repressor protein C with HTH and peptisase S24 domain
MTQSIETKRLMDALAVLKKEQRISIYQVAQKVGYAPQSFSRIKAGGQNVPLKWIHKICEAFNINKLHIFNDEQPVFLDEKPGRIVDATGKAIAKETNVKIPYYDAYLSAGMVKKFADSVVNAAFFITIPQFMDCTLALRVSGDSMYPRYRSGDIVVCKRITDKTLIMHGEPYVIITTDYCVVKYLDPHPKDDTKLTLKSENPKFQPASIPKKDILGLYLIRGKIEVL